MLDVHVRAQLAPTPVERAVFLLHDVFDFCELEAVLLGLGVVGAIAAIAALGERSRRTA